MRIMQIKRPRMSSAAAAENGSVKRSSRARRRGSTLLIVIALTGMLALLGVMFFSFASQEMENARNFNRAAARLDNPANQAEVYLEFALRQIIQGSEPNEKHSALYGPRHSIMGNLFGHDSHPFNGQGVNLTEDAVFRPIVDPGFDGLLPSANGNGNWWEDPQVLMRINDSPAANVDHANNEAVERQVLLLPAPDVDYTYPDINNIFLAYRGFTRDPLTGQLRLVIKPSFHRPELLASTEDMNGNNKLDNETDDNGNGILDAGEDKNGNGVRDFEDFDGNGKLSLEDGNGDGDSVYDDTNRNGIFDNEDKNGNGRLDAGEDENGNRKLDVEIGDGDGVFEIEDLNDDGTNGELVVRDRRWAFNGWTQSRILRPHPGHVAYVVDPQTRNLVASSHRRFLDDRVKTGSDRTIINALPGESGGFKYEFDPDGDGIPNEQGVWSFGRPQAGQDFQYEYDVDNDNDGVRDGILMDFDYKPEQRPSDGALYVPLFSAMILDAGGLLNLNIVGNLSGDTGSPSSYLSGVFGNKDSISQSLDGLSPSEVNPLWALRGHPGVDVDSSSLTDYENYYGQKPGNRQELANMAFWWLNKGRVEYGGPGSIPTIHTGRLGEEDRIWQVYQDSGGTNLIAESASSFPFPGYWNGDDNGNRYEGGSFDPLGLRPFGHPISFSGRGSFTAIGQPSQPNLWTVPGTPLQFPRYTNIGIAGDVGYRTLLGGNLMLNPGGGSLFPRDDMMEMTLEEGDGDERWSVFRVVNSDTYRGIASQQFGFDEPFSVDDSAVLQMAPSDVSNTRVTSRLTNLLPSHIDPANNDFAVDVRKMFTTASWDRKQFGLIRPSAVSADGKPGAPDFDDNGDGIIDNYPELGWPGTDDPRAWEFNVDLDGDGLAEFPPQFTHSTSSLGVRAYAGLSPFSPHPVTNETSAIARMPDLPQDPFRAPVRRMLEVEFGNTNQLRRQFPISVNHIIDVVRTPPARGQRDYVPGDPAFSPLQYRILTPHPKFKDPAEVKNVPVLEPGGVPPRVPDPLPSFPPQTDTQQEWWARYDRQRMARDIYVLLYTLCGGNDARDYTAKNSGSTALYSREQTRQMAQFAVNLVDSLDRDNAMTMFEYDNDLSDGWGLDDQAWDSTHDEPSQKSQRSFVFGVEEQQLAFTEALWLYFPESSKDAKQTLITETDHDHHFLYMELQNVGPRPARLAESTSVSHSTAVWRIRRKFAYDDAQKSLGMVEPGRLVPSIPDGENALYFRNTAPTIAPGDFYTIATGDSATGKTSRLYIDNTDDSVMNFRPVVPRTGPTVTGLTDTTLGNPNPSIDLDMTLTAPGGIYELVVKLPGTGTFLNKDTVLGSKEAATNMTLVLERRLNPELSSLPLSDNPWVTVDMLHLNRSELNIEDGDDPSTVEGKLKDAGSTLRLEPLRADIPLNGQMLPGNPLVYHRIDSQVTLSTDSRSPSPYNRYHRQLNRDFASVVELFTLPLRGPKTLTYVLGMMERRPDDQQVWTQDWDGQIVNEIPPEIDEDANGNGKMEASPLDLNGDGSPDHDEDLNGNEFFDITHEDVNNNWIRDGGEDKNSNGALESFAGPVSADAMFLQPNHPGVLVNTGGGGGGPGNRPRVPPGRGTQPGNRPDVPPGWTYVNADPNFDNHWHRLLTFVSVPTRTHLQLGNPLALTRVPGKLNLNTIRHPEVLAALLDDRDLFTAPEYDANANGIADLFEDYSGPDGDGISRFNFGLRDRNRANDPLRDYWFDLLQSRDGFDPVSYMVLPGTTSSKPFRDVGNVTGGVLSLQDTILRTHPRSITVGSARRLFELGTDAEATEIADINQRIDRNVRHSLLSKVMNNVTTRSNVFFVFLTVKFHEAYEDPLTGAVRIGGQFDLDGDGDVRNDGHRGFFVIDRSDAEQAFQNNAFDWKKLVKYRLTIN